MYRSRPSGSGVGIPQHSCVMASSSRYRSGRLEVSGGRAGVVARWAVLGRVYPSPRSSGSVGSRRALHVRTGDPHFASTRTSPGVLLALGIRDTLARPRPEGCAIDLLRCATEPRRESCNNREGVCPVQNYSLLNVLLALECFVHARNTQTQLVLAAHGMREERSLLVSAGNIRPRAAEEEDRVRGPSCRSKRRC